MAPKPLFVSPWTPETDGNPGLEQGTAHNKYNHPSKETIDSLNKLNLTYFETSKYGSIIFDLKSGTKTYYMP